MKSDSIVRRRVFIRDGLSIIKEVESARESYQSCQRVVIHQENKHCSLSDYSSSEQLIERLTSVNLALTAAK